MSLAASFAILDDVISRFEGVSLEELDESAALQTRVDRKYVVTLDRACELIRTQTDRLAVLEIEATRAFEYRSTYFDTEDLLSYRTTAHGQRRRFKVRTRHYVDEDAHYLEVKTRGPRDETIKVRTPCSGFESERLRPESVAFVCDVVGRDFDDAALAAKVNTIYHRFTLLDRVSDSRITVDVNLAFQDTHGISKRFDSIAVLETKTAGPPTVVDRGLWAQGVRPARISKFGVAMALTNDGLAANRWNRVLRSHFRWEPVAHEPPQASLVP